MAQDTLDFGEVEEDRDGLRPKTVCAALQGKQFQVQAAAAAAADSHLKPLYPKIKTIKFGKANLLTAYCRHALSHKCKCQSIL